MGKMAIAIAAIDAGLYFPLFFIEMNF